MVFISFVIIAMSTSLLLKVDSILTDSDMIFLSLSIGRVFWTDKVRDRVRMKHDVSIKLMIIVMMMVMTTTTVDDRRLTTVDV